MHLERKAVVEAVGASFVAVVEDAGDFAVKVVDQTGLLGVWRDDNRSRLCRTRSLIQWAFEPVVGDVGADSIRQDGAAKVVLETDAVDQRIRGSDDIDTGSAGARIPPAGNAP